ncbi:hypothetical protein PYCCODRAFT_1412280 [Trametes coccinea BRFM310]|uniref:Phytocyanin domain-containing protein n=1 Tax=Trametes coccinea (strain BRFM310) TaxID=1353009 RepID=A0A1Y2IMV6_TRAC3|nr:hypothetical protein PYCCODRAFT_1412280 [Trametes coccinea BRFM310]
MRVFSTLVASTLLAGIAAALPRPETDAAGLIKRTDSSYGSSGYSGSGSGSGSYSGSGSSSSSGSYSGSSSSSGSYSGSSSNSGSYSGSGSGSGSGSYSGSGSNSNSGSYSGSGSSGSGSGSNSGCSNGSCDSSSSSSTMMNDNSSTMMSDNSSTMMNDNSSTMMDSSSTMMAASSTMMYSQATQTADMTSTAATSTMTYGSGSTNWGGSGYNDCVQQCIASYGPPAASYTPPTQTQGSSSGSGSGSGTTHTVIVAPTQGVLRYVPFAVNASVGDTVMFMWGANNHTVTKSSMVEICNKTDSQPFASGEQNKPFTFTQVVNDTNPIFFYCGTPGHCQKGMFGMINGPSAYNAPTSVSQMMGGAVNASSDMAAMMAYTDRMTANNTKAASWGANLDMASVPTELHEVFLQNVMYTRAFLGANPEVLKDDGSIDLNSHGAPMKLPTDMATVNNAVDSQPSAQAAASTGAAAPAASSAASSAASPAATGKSNGAASTAASSALLGVAALAAAVLAF